MYVQAYVILREFILGNNRTGLVVNTTETVSVVGGESSSLAVDVFPGQSGIYMGSGTTQSTYTFPAATVAAWQSFMATETATPSGTVAGDLSSIGLQTSHAVSAPEASLVISGLSVFITLFIQWLE